MKHFLKTEPGGANELKTTANETIRNTRINEIFTNKTNFF